MPSTKTKTYRTSSSEETKRLGEDFAAAVLAQSRARKNSAAVFVLSGELGAGKTTFTQGFLKGMGMRGRAPSPTFVVVRHYRILSAARARAKRAKKENGKEGSFSDLFHMDAYRIHAREKAKLRESLEALDFFQIVENPRNIVIIEWGERIKPFIPKDASWLKFGYDKAEGTRIITLSS